MKNEEQRATPGGMGLYRDLHNLQQNGSASLEELKEFLGRLQGRSPQEVVGIVSTSMMVQSMVIATLGTLAIMAVFTLGPYLVYGAPQAKKTAAAPAKVAAPANAPASNATPPAQAKPGELSEEDKAKAPAKLGIDETKTADPNKNPLDNKTFDNLLDKVK